PINSRYFRNPRQLPGFRQINAFRQSFRPKTRRRRRRFQHRGKLLSGPPRKLRRRHHRRSRRRRDDQRNRRRHRFSRRSESPNSQRKFARHFRLPENSSAFRLERQSIRQSFHRKRLDHSRRFQKRQQLFSR